MSRRAPPIVARIPAGGPRYPFVIRFALSGGFASAGGIVAAAALAALTRSARRRTDKRPRLLDALKLLVVAGAPALLGILRVS